jgi:hypothetical protein
MVATWAAIATTFRKSAAAASDASTGKLHFHR